MKKDTLRIHSRLSYSRANGPGLRAVVWLQGCPFRCDGCFNEELREPNGGNDIPVNELLQWLANIKGICGITLSGGEPTEQIFPLLHLLQGVRSKTDLSIILFSGRTIDQITSLPGGNRLIFLVDVLIDGLYDVKKANPPNRWPSSSNQKIHLLTNRYSITDFSNLPFHEVLITEDGEVIESGFFVCYPNRNLGSTEIGVRADFSSVP